MNPVNRWTTGPKSVALAVALAVTASSAEAALERVGPPSSAPSIGGFPTWYMDTTGLALEFCDPRNASEIDGGWCLLLPGDPPAVPEVFPSLFFDEHFYFAATADVPTATGATAMLVMALESAFAVGAPVPGDQVVFSRIRYILNPAPVTGTYRFITPYGERSIDALAGERIFFTDDVGFTCAPGDFSCAMTSSLGPFLLPSDTPGGTEMPALSATNPTPDTDPAHFGGVFAATPHPGNGKTYIADPARIGPVTGSILPDFADSTGALRNHNIFRIEGPAGSGLGTDPVSGVPVDYVETTDFALMGRLFAGTLSGRVLVDRASYTRDAAGLKVDVFATAFETGQSRAPAQARPAAVAPQLTFFDAPCDGTVDLDTGEILPPFGAPAAADEIQMFAAQDTVLHWGQTQPAALPAAVCVKDGSARDGNGNLTPLYIPVAVRDEVAIGQALFDPASGTLNVTAVSSDQVAPPVLTLTFSGFQGDLANGQILVENLIAPPASVRVNSSALGSDTYAVETGIGGVSTPPTTPVALNDAFSFPEDSPPQTLAVLANDSGTAGATVTLTGAPRLGTAAVNPADGTITYTPNANAFGADSFTYTLQVGTQVSNTANVTLSLTPVNDLPVAVNNTANGIANLALSINVLGNDTDADGTTDLANAVLVTPPAANATVTGGPGGTFTFTATAGGTYSFTYLAQDVSGASSANAATVTVQVAAAESLAISRAEYTSSKRQLRVQGTVTPAASQTVQLDFTNNAGTVLGNAGNVTATATGAWALNASGVTLPTGATRIKATSSNGTATALALSIK